MILTKSTGRYGGGSVAIHPQTPGNREHRPGSEQSQKTLG